jgi:hypothetical protein
MRHHEGNVWPSQANREGLSALPRNTMECDLFKAQTYRDHAKARYGVQLPLFDEDNDEGNGETAT